MIELVKTILNLPLINPNNAHTQQHKKNTLFNNQNHDWN